MERVKLERGQDVFIAIEEQAIAFDPDGRPHSQRAFKATVLETTERGLFVQLDCYNYFEWGELIDCVPTYEEPKT